MENNKHGPCVDKNCSWCCNPVKIPNREIINGRKSPQKNGIDLWVRRKEILLNEVSPEEKIATFDCVNFDKNTGRCLDYEGRPNECRNTSCLNLDQGTDEEKFDKVTGIKFIKINPINNFK